MKKVLNVTHEFLIDIWEGIVNFVEQEAFWILNVINTILLIIILIIK